MIARKIRVLIAEDSVVAREMLAQILSSDEDIEVVGMAVNGEEAVSMTAELRPDLVTMDIHMPAMDGLVATEKIMAFTPTPILVVSSSVHGEGIGRAFDALESGALEVIKKPAPSDWKDLEHIGRDVIRRVKMLSRVRVITHIKGKRDRRAISSPSRTSFDEAAHGLETRSLVAIGSSTGGPSALLGILGRLPAGLPVPIVVAQHIADGFIPGLVSWLNAGSQLRVSAAAEGETVLPGVAYIAPTGLNLSMDGVTMRLGEPFAGQLYVPSADTLFDSVARSVGRSAIGVILTGMGADGALGLKAMHDAGAATIAQDEESSTVYGMPRAAAELGAADDILPIERIASRIEQLAASDLRTVS